jgi:L-cystine transport system substrate-binding protein
MKKKMVGALLAGTLLVTAFAGCGNTGTDTVAGADVKNAEEEQAEASDEIKTIYIGCLNGAYPIQYQDEDGTPTGYEIEVLKLVDEALPQYEFEYVFGTQDAAYTGLETGEYQIAISNAFYTEKRAESYNITENPIGASPSGFVVATENAEKYDTLEKIAADNLLGKPLQPGDGMTYQYELYNEEHPDAPLNWDYSSDTISDTFDQILAGRFDWAPYLLAYWVSNVEEEDGSFHDYLGKVTYIETFSVPTYVVVEKGNDALSDAISEVLGQLKDDGTLSEISEEFYGYDAFDPDVDSLVTKF